LFIEKEERSAISAGVIASARVKEVIFRLPILAERMRDWANFCPIIPPPPIINTFTPSSLEQISLHLKGSSELTVGRANILLSRGGKDLYVGVHSFISLLFLVF
jgi:hypothetical protein